MAASKDEEKKADVLAADNNDGVESWWSREEKLSHFMQITWVNSEGFNVRLDVLPDPKRRKFVVKDINNTDGDELRTILIKKQKTWNAINVEFDDEHENEYEIAIYGENDNKQISDNIIKLIKCPSVFDYNYKPNGIDPSSIIKILDKKKDKVHLYWNIPLYAFGEIEYKIIYNQGNEPKEDQIELLPYSLPMSLIPIEIQIITVSKVSVYRGCYAYDEDDEDDDEDDDEYDDYKTYFSKPVQIQIGPKPKSVQMINLEKQLKTIQIEQERNKQESNDKIKKYQQEIKENEKINHEQKEAIETMQKQLKQLNECKEKILQNQESINMLNQTNNDKQQIINDQTEQILITKATLKEKSDENTKMNAEITELKLENNNLKILLSDATEKNERCYVRNNVMEYNSKDKQQIVIPDDIQQKQTNIDNEMDVHVNRLKEWNVFNLKLDEQFNRNDKKDNDDDDDEKKTNNNNQAVIQLFNSYTNCMKLLRIQQARIDDIGEYVISLSKSKKQLKNTIKQYVTNQQPSQQRYDELCAGYTNLKLQREQLQGQVLKMMKEINRITDEENKVNKQKCDTFDHLNISVVEKEKYDKLFKKCKSLITQYNTFDKNVDDKSQELETYFNQKWDEHQRLWTKWDVDDIICWIKYMIHDNKIKLSQEINLEKVAKEMRMQKFKGKSLSKIEKNDLKLFGIIVFDDYQQIYSMIRKLVEKYPDIDKGNDEDNDVEGGVKITPKRVNIPKEYLCPISKNKIMFDPVIYDGVTYDRANLEQYLTKYKKIPGSDEPYDEDEDMLKNRKLKQKIDAFLEVNPQFRSEGV